MCRVLKISRSGFYAGQKRPLSPRAQENATLLHHIRLIHLRYEGIYGSPRILPELRDQGWKNLSLNRIARLMKKHGIQAKRKRPFRKTTNSNHHLPVAPNLLERNFHTQQPNQAWVSDITYLRTQEGWLYLCIILDLFSRRVVGWALEPYLHTELVLRALRMALLRRNPPPGLIFHSDRGSQYASRKFQEELALAEIKPSMSRRGNCLDNAVAESFFASLRAELSNYQVWNSRMAARNSVKSWIEIFYNLKRRHSFLNYLSPVNYEALTSEEIRAIA